MNSRLKAFFTEAHRSTILLAIALTVLVSVAGCARKPWREPLAEDNRKVILEVMDEMRQAETQRSNCIDSDINVFFTSHVKNRAISGYVQLMQPAFIKFVSSNPFGQPLFAFVSDGQRVQLVNTFEQLFTDRNLTTFARIYDIPPFIFVSEWGKWLTGRLPAKQPITAIRQDESHHGVWVSLAGNKDAARGQSTGNILEHLLIDPENKRISGRVFTDSNGTIQARIHYSDWLEGNGDNLSRQPGQITVTDLDYGGELVLKFSDLQAMESCSNNDFTLRKPPGYRYDPLPAEK